MIDISCFIQDGKLEIISARLIFLARSDFDVNQSGAHLALRVLIRRKESQD